ncbi:MAG: HpsJ family protein [Cyanobacteria bacterium J06634_6]
MTYISAPSITKSESTYSAKNIARIIGLVCIVGFLFDMIILGLPPQNNAEWRVGFVQEFANRSIILLFGLGLLIFGSTGNRKIRLSLVSRLCVISSLLFFLLCIGSVVDSIRLSQQAIGNISTQETQLRAQIDAAKSNPDSLPENVDLADLDQFSQQLSQQANSIRSNAKRTVLKTGISNIGNLAIVGVGMFGLGRVGMGLSRSMKG